MWNTLRAVLYLVMVETLSYPLELVERSISLVVIGALCFFGGAFIDTAAAGQLGMGYAAYALVGLAVLHLFEATLTRFQTRLRSFQMAGVLEICLTTRTPFWQFILAIPAFDLAIAALQASLLITAGFLIEGLGVAPVRAALALLVLAAGLSSYLLLGLLGASGVLVFKRGDPATKLVHLASIVFGGAFFPREALPPLLGTAAGWLPIAPTLDAVRGLLLTSAPIAEVTAPLWRLGVLICLLAAVAIPVFRWALVRARRDGSLAHY
jgi:ABC-2 type transport system permease protein